MARLEPIRDGSLDQLASEGRVVPGQGDTVELADLLGLPVASAGKMTLTAALEELRGDDLAPRS